MDPQVDLFFSRDLVNTVIQYSIIKKNHDIPVLSKDSDLSTQRELDALDEFLANDSYSFHAMRDHPWHGVEILGGLWGVKLWMPETRENMMGSYMQMMMNSTDAYLPRTTRGVDQTLLSRYCP